MVSSSKILTVSYGTFSCTAEGFDDPLEVVKETTHFFRGVVGEDRFFGAEPPQFDPELASEYLRDRLADGGARGGTLTLGSPPRVRSAAASAGAMAASFGSEPARTAPAADLLPDDDTIEATAVLTERPAPEDAEIPAGIATVDTAPDGAEDAPAPPTSAPKDIAAKLDRIRAVVAQAEIAEASAPADPAAPAGDDPQADLLPTDVTLSHADPSAELLADMAEAGEAAAPDNDAETDAAEAPTENLFTAEAEEDAKAVLEPDSDPEDDALESLLGELVVESADTEELDLDAATDETPEDNDSALDAAVAALVGSKDRPAAGSDDAGRPKADEDEDALDEAWTAKASASGPAARHDRDFDDETVGDVARDTAPDAAPRASPVRARIVKVKRAALEQAIDSGALEEVFDTQDPSPAPISESSLSPEEEEDLARELAAVKAELASDFGAWDEDEDEFEDTDDTAEADWDDEEDDAEETLARRPEAAAAPLRLDNPIRASDDDWAMDPEDRIEDDEIAGAVRDSARKAVKLASPARAMLTEREVEDEDTSRLLDQTNSEMDEPEGNRRRSAIAHLRAAVAATKADRMLGRKTDAAEEQEPYREDLASVVRPRRPQTASVRTERPVSEPATPLKLVAEQRVDSVDRAAASAPVRPRRVRRATPEEQAEGSVQDESGFAVYARSVGATDLPELLEAAAAYMSYVEGRDQFSRPQLMTTLRQAEVTDSSREDRLRSFGQLLREGKIRKTSGGRFTAAETISFKPAANG